MGYVMTSPPVNWWLRRDVLNRPPQSHQLTGGEVMTYPIDWGVALQHASYGVTEGEDTVLFDQRAIRLLKDLDEQWRWPLGPSPLGGDLQNELHQLALQALER